MTRLCPPLSFADAARVQELLLDETLRKASRAAALTGGEMIVCHSPDDGGGYFAGRVDQASPQGSGDLGERMHRCIAEALREGYDGAVLVGTDIPGLTAEILAAAVEALGDHEAVLGPTADGGYYLIGFRDPPPRAVFADIPWSTGQTAGETRRRFATAGIRWGEVSRLGDIDRFWDLKALAGTAAALLSPENARLLAAVLAPYDC